MAASTSTGSIVEVPIIDELGFVPFDQVGGELLFNLIAFFYDWDWRGAERVFVRSIELNPNNGEALSYYALFLAFEGRVEEALAAGCKALSLDPLAPLVNMHVGWTYFAAGRPIEASQQAAKMVENSVGLAILYSRF